MSLWDPFDLSAAPLSAYTPGQGDIKMEGKMETASGAPVYHLEDYLSGNAPYVTGATNKKNPSGQVVYRTVGDNVVPVKITDYGPGVKGIDIASSNKRWATNFPYQGSKDMTLLSGPAVAPSTPSSVPMPVSGQYASAGNPSQMGTMADYAAALKQPSPTGSVFTGLGNALSQIGMAQARAGQQGTSQAMALLNQRRPSGLSQFLPAIGSYMYG